MASGRGNAEDVVREGEENEIVNEWEQRERAEGINSRQNKYIIHLIILQNIIV